MTPALAARALTLVACFAAAGAAAADPPLLRDALVDFGEPNLAATWRRLRFVELRLAPEPFRVMQLGDSHTAGDWFTHELRRILQARFGDAGPGWLPPGRLPGQRSSQVMLANDPGWRLHVSRDGAGEFPLGGAYGQAEAPNAGFAVELRSNGADGLWKLSLLLSGPPGAGVVVSDAKGGETRFSTTAPDWRYQSAYIEHAGALRIRADDRQMLVGGIVLERPVAGVVFDSIGLNGAKATLVRAWQAGDAAAQLRERRPGVVILAFGTNEMFEPDLDAERYLGELQDTLRWFRQTLPQAVLVVVAPPDAGRPGAKSACPPEPRWATMVRTMLRRVAREQRTLYWDWQFAMGGRCAIGRWAKASPPWASGDLVHLTEPGYAASAAQLAGELMALYEQRMRMRMRGRL
jgi:lysophospholipase L1-like esterase